MTTCLMRSALKAADPVPRFSLLTRWASSDQARAGVSPCFPPVGGPWPAPAAPALPGLGRQAPLAVGLCLRDGPSSSLQWTVQMHTLTSCPCVSPENAAQCAALGKSLHPRLALVLAAWHTGPPHLPPPRGAASAAAATVTPPSAFLSDLGPRGQPRITSRLQSLHLTAPAATPSHEGTLTGPERQDATWLGTRCSAGHADHALLESSADRGRPECGSGRLCQQRGHDDEEMAPQQPEQAPAHSGRGRRQSPSC